MGSWTRFSVEFSCESYLVFFLACFTEWHLFGCGLKDLVLLHKLLVKVV